MDSSVTETDSVADSVSDSVSESIEPAEPRGLVNWKRSIKTVTRNIDKLSLDPFSLKGNVLSITAPN